MLEITKQTILAQSAYDYLNEIIWTYSGNKSTYNFRYGDKTDLNIFLERVGCKIYIRTYSPKSYSGETVLATTNIQDDLDEWKDLITYLINVFWAASKSSST